MQTYIVDSFTDKAFKGNPAGVCFIKDDVSDQLMQSIAKELGFSETAFIKKQDQDTLYSIRFFSPVMEIPLCGHATLASAKVLFSEFNLDHMVFETINKLKLDIKKDGDQILMEFPIYETIPAEAPKKLLSALGINEIENVAYNKETNILLLEIGSTQILSGLRPDFKDLYNAHDSINGVLITARSHHDDYDFHSRYFWPWSGTNEDPVTGGTHTFLAKYWGDRLKKKKMRSFQSSKRTGFMEVELYSAETLYIRGQAVIVFSGYLNLSSLGM